MRPAVIDPRFVGMVGASGFFPATGSIEERTATSNSFGEEEYTWAVVPGLEEVNLAFSPVTGSGEEVRQPSMTRVTETNYALLQGYYPQIEREMRLVIDDAAWNILSVDADSQSSITRLTVEQVSL